jgi:hypothetical protein
VEPEIATVVTILSSSSMTTVFSPTFRNVPMSVIPFD